jgi:parallel beta-helix repeat protein
VDSAAADDTANGLTPATPWKTIAKVNSTTLAAGQSVGFKRGGTWRETLMPGQGGSADSPITFTGYGTGAAPIVNGADVISSAWTPYGSAPGTVTHVQGTSHYTATGTAGSVTLTNNPTTGNLVVVAIKFYDSISGLSVKDSNNNVYTLVPDNSPSSYVGPVWMAYLLSAPANASKIINATWTNSVYSVVWGDEFHPATGTSITYDRDAQAQSGGPSTTPNTPTITPSTAGSLLYSGLSNSVSGTNAPAANGTLGVWTGSGGGPNTSHPGNAEYVLAATGATAVNYTTGSGVWSALVAAFTLANSDTGTAGTYKHALTTQPRRVWNGATELTYHSGGLHTLAANEFDWASGVLYVNVGSDPTGGSIEAGQRDPVSVHYSYLTFKGLTMTKGNSAGIGDSVADSSYVTVRNCTISYSGQSGVYIGSQSVTIGNWTFANNTISNNGLLANLDHGVYVADSSNNTFIGNTFDSNRAWGLQLQYGSANNTITKNYFHSNVAGGVVISQLSGRTPTGTIVTYNVTNGGVVGVEVSGSMSAVIENNTLYGFTGSGLKTYLNPSGMTFKNNIVWSGVASVAALDDEGASSAMTSDYNVIGVQASNYIYWGGTGYATVANFFSNTGLDQHSIGTDPLFTNAGTGDFTLQAGSPAIGTGVYISGVSTSATPNIGAK